MNVGPYDISQNITAVKCVEFIRALYAKRVYLIYGLILYFASSRC